MFKTLFRVLAGFLLACLAAGLVQVLYVWTPAELAAVPSAAFPEKAGSTLELALLAATHSAIFGAAFALIAAGISEWLAIRGIAYYLFAGTAIALLGFAAQYASEVSGQPTILNNYAIQAYLTAGFFSGLVYWLTAGHRAGAHGYDEDTKGSDEPRQRIIVEKTPAGMRKPGSLAEKLAKPLQATEAAATSAAKSATSVPVTKPAVSVKVVDVKSAEAASEENAKKT